MPQLRMSFCVINTLVHVTIIIFIFEFSDGLPWLSSKINQYIKQNVSCGK